MAKTVFDVLNEKIDADIESATSFLGKGSAIDYSAYRETCGLIRGLKAAQHYINDLSRAMENDDE